MASQGWYIRLDEQVLGPISEAELRDLAMRGAANAQTPVSCDGVSWTEAATLPGITFGIPLSRSPSPPPIPSTHVLPSGQLSSGWLFGAILGGGVLVLICSGLLLVVLAALAKDSTPASSPAVADLPLQPSASEQAIAQKTLVYWQALGRVLSQGGPPGDATAQIAVTSWHGMAARIRALPTSGVDPDAVQCGLDVATVLDNMADFVAQSNSPAILVEAYLRGAAGDPFGTAAEILDARSNLQRQLQQVQSELDSARAVLSSRYGIEFPAL
jgi:hypothetical protein